MFGLESLEGIKDIPSINKQSVELSDVQREYISEVIPDESMWKEMSAIEKAETLNLLETRMDEIRDMANAYDLDFSSVTPEYMLESSELPFRDMIEFEDRGTFAVKEFFERDSFREIPYAEADSELRSEYMKDFYANYSEFSGKNPPLEFKEMSPGNMGAYNPETNTITLNSRLLVTESPNELMDTILHESRHAFQQYAVEHPDRVSVDRETVALWKDNMDYYIRPEWDYEAYKNQPIEADADKFAENTMKAGLLFIA